MTEELLRKLKENRFIVFGTGFVSEMFLRALEIRGLQGNLTGFLVSDSSREGTLFHGLPVHSTASYVQGNEIICLAVHEANLTEIREQLYNTGIRDILWVYPYLHELIFGPVLYTANIPLDQLIAAQDPAYYWISVRYSILEDHDEAIYLKAIALHTSRKTAEHRLRQYRTLIQSVLEKGYDPAFPILIDTRGRIIDGLHRLALAVYTGLPAVRCQVTEAAQAYDRILREENYLPEDKLVFYGFTEEEIRKLKKIQKKIGIADSHSQSYREVVYESESEA